MDVWSVVSYGVIGGALPDVLRVIRERYGVAPDYLRKWHFWLGFALMLILGGFVAWISDPKKIFDAIACGLTAPVVLQGLASDKSAEPTLAASAALSGAIRDIRYWWSK